MADTNKELYREHFERLHKEKHPTTYVGNLMRNSKGSYQIASIADQFKGFCDGCELASKWII